MHAKCIVSWIYILCEQIVLLVQCNNCDQYYMHVSMNWGDMNFFLDVSRLWPWCHGERKRWMWNGKNIKAKNSSIVVSYHLIKYFLGILTYTERSFILTTLYPYLCVVHNILLNIIMRKGKVIFCMIHERNQVVHASMH